MEEDNLTPEEELHAENEIEKVRLDMEFGAAQWGGEENIDPALTSEFLKNIRAFNEHTVEEIPLREFLGDPTFVLADELSEEEADEKVNEFFDLLDENNMHIDRPMYLSSKDFYKFLTTEFLETKVDKKPIPGMNTGFIYSEFVPDCLDNVFFSAEGFFRNFFNGNEDMLKYDLTKFCGRDDLSEAELVPSDKVIEKYVKWKSTFKSLTDEKIEWGAPERREGYTHFPFQIVWSGELEDGSAEPYEGEGYLQLVFALDIGYFIKYLEMPGFKF